MISKDNIRHRIKKSNRIVLTGGPGMGKTAIINRLEEMGYHCVQESGRAIIRQQLATGGDALPWINPAAFAQAMYRQALADFEAAAAYDPVFFDRGLPDVIGYLNLCGLPVPPAIEIAARQLRYHHPVFITPPWEEIYVNDRERKQSFPEAVATYEQLNRTYTALGYRVIKVPRRKVQERVDFLLGNLVL